MEPITYTRINKTCKRCNKPFSISPNEQEWLLSRGLKLFAYCKECREINRGEVTKSNKHILKSTPAKNPFSVEGWDVKLQAELNKKHPQLAKHYMDEAMLEAKTKTEPIFLLDTNKDDPENKYNINSILYFICGILVGGIIGAIITAIILIK